MIVIMEDKKPEPKLALSFDFLFSKISVWVTMPPEKDKNNGCMRK